MHAFRLLLMLELCASNMLEMLEMQGQQACPSMSLSLACHDGSNNLGAVANKFELGHCHRHNQTACSQLLRSCTHLGEWTL